MNTIVPMAIATANLSDTSAEASFINASPCKIPISFFDPVLTDNADSATASVGDRTAASAKAATNGISGSSSAAGNQYPPR